LLAASASAQAGITIPAGDWTVDIGGNVNAFYTHTSFSGDLETNTRGVRGEKSTNTIQTGLLPSALGIGAKTRQNDLDVAVQFTFFVGADSGGQTSAGGNSINIRQGYMTFGDASWGSVKLGRDLGVFASDAILSDMTLLGVGNAAGHNGSSTLGRIGSGYQYADWKGQIAYTSPNWNGFDFTVAATQGWTSGTTGADATNHNLGYEGKVGYSWTGDVAGKVWASALSQKHEATATAESYTSSGFDIGGKISTGGLGLVAYYYDGKGLSGAGSVTAGGNAALNGAMYYGIGINNKTDDKGGYVQATYAIPTGTKLGVSWGQSKSEADLGRGEFTNRSWIVGAYHPLTKSVNLVAEYTNQKLEGTNANNATVAADALDGKAKTFSLGAILFF